MKKIKSPNVDISANTREWTLFKSILYQFCLVCNSCGALKKKNYVNKLTLLLTFFGLFIVIVGLWRSFDYLFVLIVLVFFSVHFTFLLLVHAEEFSSG